MESLKSNVLKLGNYNSIIINEINSKNIHRIYFMAKVIGLINIAHIAIFAFTMPEQPSHVVQWHYQIIMLHALMFLINSIFGLIAFKIEKKGNPSSRFAYSITYITIFANLLIGTLICISDQLVTSNINALFITCIGIGAIFIIPPVIAAIVYSITLVMFFCIITWIHDSPELLQHVLVNSVTATIMGFAVSWVLWRNHLVSLQQQGIIEDQRSKLEEKNKSLQFLASHDPLTGALNRTSFLERVEMQIMENSRTDNESCIVLLDFDFFNQINDNFGHPAGDKVLEETSRIITRTLRSSDIFARLGGEEFIILLPATPLQAGSKVAEKLRQIIQDHACEFEGDIIKVTVSFGLSRLLDSFHASYIEADKALYTAKKNGRNYVAVAE